MQKKIVNGLEQLFIDKNFINQRLDNFLFNKIKNVPKSRIYRMLRNGEIRINKKRIKPSYKLLLNDVVRIPPFWNVAKILNLYLTVDYC